MSKSRVASALQSHTVEVFPFEVSNLEAENILLSEEIARLRLRLVEVERSADTDPLMDLYNRRAFMRELGRAQAVNARYDIPSTILFFDLNGFKAVNDQYGHGFGDEMLIGVGKVLSDNVRHCDMVARLGGDEFGVILFKTDEKTGKAKAASLACQISEQIFSIDYEQVQVSAAWGVAPCDSAQTPKQILARADRAMYVSKFEMKRGVDLTSLVEFKSRKL